jgi:hypothetical protein
MKKKFFFSIPVILLFSFSLVVILNGERIFLGAFWIGYSSLPALLPRLEATFFSRQTPTISNSKKAWDYLELDLSNDQIIFKSLKKYGLLALR